MKAANDNVGVYYDLMGGSSFGAALNLKDKDGNGLSTSLLSLPESKIHTGTFDCAWGREAEEKLEIEQVLGSLAWDTDKDGNYKKIEVGKDKAGWDMYEHYK